MKYSTVLLVVIFTTACAQHHGIEQSGTKCMGDNRNLGKMGQITGWGHIGGHRCMAHSFAVPAGHLAVGQLTAGYMKSGQMRTEQRGLTHLMERNLVPVEHMTVAYIGAGQMETGHVGSGQMIAVFTGTEQTGGHHRVGRSLRIPAGHTSSGFVGDAHMTGTDVGVSRSMRYTERIGYRTARQSVLTTMGGTKMSVSNTKMSVSGPGITPVTINIRGLMAGMMHI